MSITYYQYQTTDWNLSGYMPENANKCKRSFRERHRDQDCNKKGFKHTGVLAIYVMGSHPLD